MVLDHILHAAISPVLVLLEVGHEAGTCDSGKPTCGNSLHRASKQQGGKIHAQSGADQSHSAFDHPKACQGPADRHGEFLRPVSGQLDAIDLSLIHI